MLVDQYSNQDTTVLVNKYDADSLSALRPCPQLLLVFGFDASSVVPHQRQHEELA